MIIYSWNMLFRNPRQDEAFNFIANGLWDVFCLQEVPEEFLERLASLPFYLAKAVETRRLYKGVEAAHYVVTLSRTPFVGSKAISIGEKPGSDRLHSRLFRWAMFSIGLWAKGMGVRQYLVTQILTQNRAISILNMHLPLTTPEDRAQDFSRVMSDHDDSEPTIVCGDFNIVEKPHITILNWLLGGSLGDWLQFTRERQRIETEFSGYRLINPLRGISTHPFSRSQLDHILVPKHFAVEKASVIKERYGSDHHPICICIT